MPYSGPNSNMPSAVPTHIDGSICPPVMLSACPAVMMRGAAIQPFLDASAKATAISVGLGMSCARSRTVVKPAMRVTRALRAPRRAASAAFSVSICSRKFPPLEVRCTCESMRPGMSVRSPRSMLRASAGTEVGLTLVIFPLTTTTRASRDIRPVVTSSRRADERTSVSALTGKDSASIKLRIGRIIRL